MIKISLPVHEMSSACFECTAETMVRLQPGRSLRLILLREAGLAVKQARHHRLVHLEGVCLRTLVYQSQAVWMDRLQLSWQNSHAYSACLQQKDTTPPCSSDDAETAVLSDCARHQ